MSRIVRQYGVEWPKIGVRESFSRPIALLVECEGSSTELCWVQNSGLVYNNVERLMQYNVMGLVQYIEESLAQDNLEVLVQNSFEGIVIGASDIEGTLYP